MKKFHIYLHIQWDHLVPIQFETMAEKSNTATLSQTANTKRKSHVEQQQNRMNDKCFVP